MGHDISVTYGFHPGKGSNNRSTYQWTRNGTSISTGTVENNLLSHYVVTASDIGASIGIKITPKNELGHSGAMVSAEKGVVRLPPRVDNLRVIHNNVMLQEDVVIRVGDQMTAEYTFISSSNQTDRLILGDLAVLFWWGQYHF